MKKSVLVVSHFLFWIFSTIATPYVFTVTFWTLTHTLQRPNALTPNERYYLEIDYPGLLIFTVIGACIFYASYFSLNFFVQRPFRFIWIVLFYIVCTLIMSLPADFVSRQAWSKLGPVLYFNLCGFLFKACVEWYEDRKLKIDLERDREVSQLELLKSKIDTHFLFNNLNNIDVFIQEDPQLASKYLKKLSDILRFMLYESNVEKVPLTMELEYISNYIDLQKIRTSNVNFVKFEVNGEAMGKKISPMILIHLIENAFKYAGNKKIAEAVSIRFDITDKEVSFFCKNHVSSAPEGKDANGGLGIQLLKQKLNLIYKNNYTLIIEEENNWYIVNLNIRLDED